MYIQEPSTYLKGRPAHSAWPLLRIHWLVLVFVATLFMGIGFSLGMVFGILQASK